jgi:mRNA interferase RelE/StbE
MELAFEADTRRTLDRMQRKIAVALIARLQAIAADPFARHANVERMVGIKDGFRLRQGDWRATYWVDRETRTVRVMRIAPRGEVYKR